MKQYLDPNQLNYSKFTRNLYAFTDTPHALFALVGDWLKQRHTEAHYDLYSFPVAVCHKMRYKHLGRAFPAVSY